MSNTPIAAAKTIVIDRAILAGLDVRSDVSSSGIIVCGAQEDVETFINLHHQQAFEPYPYDPTQQGDTDDDL